MYVWFICMLAVSKLSVPLFVSILPGPWRKQPPLSGGLAPSSVVVYGIESTSGSGKVSSLRLHHQVKLSNNYKEISYFLKYLYFAFSISDGRRSRHTAEDDIHVYKSKFLGMNY